MSTKVFFLFGETFKRPQRENVTIFFFKFAPYIMKSTLYLILISFLLSLSFVKAEMLHMCMWLWSCLCYSFFVKSYQCSFDSVGHSVEKREILSYRNNISWKQLFINFFSKNVTFTKFFLNSRKMLQYVKYRESKFLKILTLLHMHRFEPLDR